MGRVWDVGEETSWKNHRGVREGGWGWICEPCTEDFEGQESESNRRRWQERPLLGGQSPGMGQEPGRLVLAELYIMSVPEHAPLIM